MATGSLYTCPSSGFLLGSANGEAWPEAKDEKIQALSSCIPTPWALGQEGLVVVCLYPRSWLLFSFSLLQLSELKEPLSPLSPSGLDVGTAPSYC